MSADQIVYLDSSAIVKLVVGEPESAALRRYLRRGRRSMVSSALARAEVMRSLLEVGAPAVVRAQDVLGGLDLVRVNDRVLAAAGVMRPAALRTLDAIHLATAALFGRSLAALISYDARMAAAARELGWVVRQPA